MPLIVLSAENGVEAWKSSTHTITDEDRNMWLLLQKQQATLSSNSQWVLINGSGHYIHFDCPETLTKVIFALLAKAPSPGNFPPTLTCS